MDKYLLPEDDGLTTRTSGQWVKEKLYYLKRYVDVFGTSMRKKDWRRRIYIDLFAGPGKCSILRNNEIVLGSPLLAINTQHPFTDYYFVDIEDRNINVLKQRCKISPLVKNIQFIIGDANDKAQEIADEIIKIDEEFMQGRWSSLNLAFLDPEGLELRWNTVRALAQVNKMDLIIHYSQSGLTRNLKLFYNSEHETVIDKFFGDRNWRKIYRDAQGKETIGVHRELIDYYKSNLRALGYTEVLRDDETGAEPLIRNSKKQTPLYRLLFASKHPLGHNFWKEVTRKDVYGQSRFL